MTPEGLLDRLLRSGGAVLRGAGPLATEQLEELLPEGRSAGELREIIAGGAGDLRDELRRWLAKARLIVEHGELPGGEAAAALEDAFTSLAERAQGAWSERFLAAAVEAVEISARRRRAGSRHRVRLGGYRLERVLGRGATGVVYAAVQESTGREVAVKKMRAEAFGHDNLLRFRMEARVLAKLAHPGIAQILEAGAAAGDGQLQPFLAMELVDGEPITCYADRHGLGVRERIVLMRRVAQAVQHAHERGVIHRDLKPSNILVDRSGQPKVLDFGVAASPGEQVTVDGSVLGTPGYMSPEQLGGGSVVADTRSDVYALGVVLFELLTGELPHRIEGRPFLEAVHRIGSEPPRRLRELRSRLHADLEAVVGKALAAASGDRYASSGELVEELQRYLAGRPVAARPAGVVGTVWRWSRRRRLLVGAVACFLLLLAAGGIGTVLSLRRALAAEDRLADQLAEERALSATVFELGRRLGDATTDLARSGAPHSVQRRIVEAVQAALEGLPAGAVESDRRGDLRADLTELAGDLAFRTGDFESARIHREEVLAIRRRLLAERPGDPPRRADLSIAMVKRGDLDKERNDRVGARRWYRDALALDAGLVQDDPDEPDWLDNLAYSYERLGHLALQEEKTDEALRLCGLRHRTVRRLVELDDRPMRHFNLGRSHLMLIEVLLEGDCDDPELDRHVAAALEISARLTAGDPGNATFRRLRREALTRAAGLHTSRGEHRAALASEVRAQALLERLWRRDPEDVHAFCDAVHGQRRLARRLIALGRRDRARSMLEEAVQRLRRRGRPENLGSKLLVEAARMVDDLAGVTDDPRRRAGMKRTARAYLDRVLDRDEGTCEVLAMYSRLLLAEDGVDAGALQEVDGRLRRRLQRADAVARDELLELLGRVERRLEEGPRKGG